MAEAVAFAGCCVFIRRRWPGPVQDGCTAMAFDSEEAFIREHTVRFGNRVEVNAQRGGEFANRRELRARHHFPAVAVAHVETDIDGGTEKAA